MSTSKELVRKLYDAFARGDVETVLGAMDEAIDWREAEGGPLAVGNPYIGPNAVLEGVFGPLTRDIEGFRVEPERLVADEGDVVALGRYTGTHTPSGRDLDAQFAHHWTVRDGRVVAFQQYTDTAQWSRIYAES